MQYELNMQETNVVLALQNYVGAAPYHEAGLCYWLHNISNICSASYDQHAPTIHGYSLIRAAARADLIPSYLKYDTLEGKTGPTSARIELAKTIIKLICDGKLLYEVNKWKGIPDEV